MCFETNQTKTNLEMCFLMKYMLLKTISEIVLRQRCFGQLPQNNPEEDLANSFPLDLYFHL